MKKVFIIFAFLLLAAGCDKTVYSQPAEVQQSASSSSPLNIITNPTTDILTSSTTPQTKPSVKKSSSSNNNASLTASPPALPAQQLLQFSPTPTPTPTQPVIDVCNNIGGAQPNVPTGYIGDGQGNCYSATDNNSPIAQKQAAALQAQQAAAEAAQQKATLADQQAQQQAALEAQQEKTNQINALTSQYNTQFNALTQQILNIKKQYYIDSAAQTNQDIAMGTPTGLGGAHQQNLLDKANGQIAQIQLQEQQLYLNYQTQLNALK